MQLVFIDVHAMPVGAICAIRGAIRVRRELLGRHRRLLVNHLPRDGNNVVFYELLANVFKICNFR